MYATCLFCHAALGTNESIEHFPIGKRLAFDAAKGRLWVVCQQCERWNLSPLDERFEAIEEAERAYRDTKKRVTTDQVGLARLRDGTDLIRIGEPLRPEFAAWRYGDTFGRRTRRRVLLGASAAVAGAGVASSIVLGVSAIAGATAAFGFLPSVAFHGWYQWHKGYRRLTLLDNDGKPIKLSPHGLSFAMLTFQHHGGDEPDQIKLGLMDSNVPKPPRTFHPRLLLQQVTSANYEFSHLDGTAATHALASILAVTNASAGTSAKIQAAVATAESAASPFKLLTSMTAEQKRQSRKRVRAAPAIEIAMASDLPPVVRLALEMSLHEESERRALQGELHELTQRWKEAEEVAAISDWLFLAPKGDAQSD